MAFPSVSIPCPSPGSYLDEGELAVKGLKYMPGLVFSGLPLTEVEGSVQLY
jgi:hypothetical protein